jgi:pSer/pThr/pTyr-binding forkhead associated (FHA) protein
MLVLKRTADANPSAGIPARIVFDKPTTTLGRNSSAADIFINSQRRPNMISRVHARIKRNEATGAYTMTSHGMNGVLVNEMKTDRVELKDGDVVVFGGSGVETRVGQRVKKPDSDLVYRFCAVSENDETRCSETSADQTLLMENVNQLGPFLDSVTNRFLLYR